MLFVAIASSIQVGLQLTLLFWYFFLVWKTFPFRFGLLRQLIVEEVPVIMFVPVNFILYFSERLLRLHYIEWNKYDDIVSLYDNGVYMAVFWARNLFSVFMFAVSVKSVIQLGHPDYYKPSKWLKI